MQMNFMFVDMYCISVGIFAMFAHTYSHVTRCAKHLSHVRHVSSHVSHVSTHVRHLHIFGGMYQGESHFRGYVLHLCRHRRHPWRCVCRCATIQVDAEASRKASTPSLDAQEPPPAAPRCRTRYPQRWFSSLRMLQHGYRWSRWCAKMLHTRSPVSSNSSRLVSIVFNCPAGYYAA